MHHGIAACKLLIQDVLFRCGTTISNQNVGVDPIVTFQTTLVTAALLNSGGIGLEDGLVKYYASGWKDFGTTDASGQCTMELLPVSYSFKMYYLGAAQQISNQNVSVDPIVTFQTALVTAALLNSVGIGLEDGLVKYYASGWKDFGTTDASGQCTMELLPVSYSFKMYYLGASQQISNHNIANNNVINFHTSEITVEFRYDDGTLGIDGGIVTYYASGWKDFGVTGSDGPGIVKKELLPVSYSFKMIYDGSTQQISNQNTLNYPIVCFYEGAFKSSPAFITEDDISDAFSIYPNPFVTSLNINFPVGERCSVSLIIYDLDGRIVKTLYNSTLDTGMHTFTWNGNDIDGKDLPNGMYLVYLITAEQVETLKVLKMK